MGWLAWVEKSFTEDSVHIDRELGTYRGRQAIKEWMESLLPMFPPVFSYELEWYMIDGDRVVTYHRDGFLDPRGGSPFAMPGEQPSIFHARNARACIAAGDGVRHRFGSNPS